MRLIAKLNIYIIAVFCTLIIHKAVAFEMPVIWFDSAWKYRQVVIRDTTKPKPPFALGAAEIDTGGNILAEGADIRVTDARNNPVPYRVTSVSRDGRVRVEFVLIEGAGGYAYSIYYGNPDARPLFFDFPDKSGGLSITVKTLNDSEIKEVESFMTVFNSSERVIGQGSRTMVRDRQQPFSDKAEKCLAIYSGVLRIPADGIYGFQLKATGGAFLEIDGNIVLHQLLNENKTPTVDGLNFTAGDHPFNFYIANRHPSAYVAELFWRIPGEKSFAIIPPEAFPSTVLFSPASRERYGSILNAFFSFNIRGKIRLVGSDEVLSSVKFRNHSRSFLGEMRSVHWDFGDGGTSTEPEPEYLYRKPGDYRVRMTAVNESGFRDVSDTTIRIDRFGAERIEIQWQIQVDNQLIETGEEKIPFRHSFRVRNLQNMNFILRTVTIADGKVIEGKEEPFVFSSDKKPGEGHLFSAGIPNRNGSFEVRYTLIQNGIAIISRSIRVIEDTKRFPHLKLADAFIVDETGATVVIKLTKEPNRESRSLASIMRRKNNATLNIAVIDNSLCPGGRGWDESGFYYRILESKMREKYPDTEVTVRRVAGGNSELNYFPLARIVSTASEIYDFDPDVVIITCDIDHIFTFTPPEVLSRHFALMIHNYIANTQGKIILATPPPMPSAERAYRTKNLSVSISRIALQHYVAIADIYQAVNLYDGDWTRLFQDEKSSGSNSMVYYLHMNSQGQEIIAETLYKAVIKD